MRWTIPPFTFVNDSSFLSDDYATFCELGYPQLDRVVFKDGEWALIEMMNTPVIPSLCRWKYVLKGLRHTEFNADFVRRFIEISDPTHPKFWYLHDKKTAETEALQNAAATHQEQTVDKAVNIISKNESLVNRIAQNGFSEIAPEKMLGHMYKTDPWALRRMGVTATEGKRKHDLRRIIAPR